MRYELKYTFQVGYYDQLVKAILNSTNLYREIYYERQVNNIYYDTDDLHDYYQNLAGVGNRAKYRIRWYGSLHAMVDKPVLERKYKMGMVGGKKSAVLPGFDYSHGFSNTAYFGLLKKSLGNKDLDYQTLVMDLLWRGPSVVNSYQRRYFSSPNGLVRVTIDRDINYYHAQNGNLRHRFNVRDEQVILEVKYDHEVADNVSNLIQGLGYRVSRNSKYVNGINAIYFSEQLH